MTSGLDEGAAVDLQSELAFVLLQCDQTGHRVVARQIAQIQIWYLMRCDAVLHRDCGYELGLRVK